MAHAMLRLLASPKMTAVFCVSLILESSVVSLQFAVKKTKQLLYMLSFNLAIFRAVCRYRSGSNAMKGLLNFLYGIAQHHWASVRTAHRAIGFRQRVQQPFHFRLFERHVHLDRRVARRGRRDFCL